MSKNRKNRKEAAFLRNFTTDIINRMILCDDSIQNKQSIIKEDSFKETLRRITENTNYNSAIKLYYPTKYPLFIIKYWYRAIK